jgi:glycosyltransferase involved in cell wall biosynthesis
VRVLLASHRYYPSAGGTEQHVRHLSEGLARRGVDVTVVTSLEAGLVAEETIAGVKVRRLPLHKVAGVRIPKGYLRFLRNFRADLFHLQGNRIWCADFYFPWARFFRWPQVLTGHGFYQWEIHPRARDRWYFRRYFPWAVRAFDRYVTLTEHERELLLRWGVPSEKLAYIPHGIDPADFATEPPAVAELRKSWGVERKLVAVYAGGFYENKRVDRLIEAVAAVKDTWALVALGHDVPGSRFDRAYCERLAHDRGVEFHAVGPVSRQDTIRAIFAADAVLLGSEYEGFGLLPVEAMAAGRPFVAFDAGAARQLSLTGGGNVVRSVPEMTLALQELTEAGARRRIGEAGRRGMSGYTSEVMVDRYLDLYSAILAARNSRRGGTRSSALDPPR